MKLIGTARVVRAACTSSINELNSTLSEAPCISLNSSSIALGAHREVFDFD